MKHGLNSLFVHLCVIGAGILFLAESSAVAAETLKGKQYVNKTPSFSITVPLWDEMSKWDDDYLALGYGMLKMPQIIVGKAHDVKNQSFADSLISELIKYLKARYSGTDFEVLYEKEAKLVDGTPSFEAGLRWSASMIPMYSSCIWATKEGTGVFAVVSDMGEITDPLKSYLYTLSIK